LHRIKEGKRVIEMNTLYYGDNLDILRDKIPSDYVDLIYLDPPFQSGKNYNIIFQPELNKIKGATAQIKTFEDTWRWGDEAEKEYQGLITGTITKEKPSQKLIELIKAMRSYLGECSMMGYLSMMAPRLVEMGRVMKDTGSIYLHCDPTASHYLKLLMDAVYGPTNFRNECIWHYKRWPAGKFQFQRMHDVILFYSKIQGKNVFNLLLEPLTQGTLKRWRGQKSRVEFKDGIRQVTKMTEEKSRGTSMDDVWDIPVINSQAKERLGYPTQKPEVLLERIIKASSNVGDLVLDPFCGCGTTIAVAESLKRRWIGIDITYLAIDVIKKRLEKNRVQAGVDFEIDGEPTDVYSAEKLAGQDPFQFQLWCISKLDATPSETKTGDQGIDGIVNFIDLTKRDKAGKGIIQVKGTQSVNPSMVRDLKGTIKSQNADFGILITLKKATQGMITEAVKEGYTESTKKIPKIQLLTVEDLLKKPIPIILPGQVLPPYRKPEFKKEQGKLF
jgi:site-specific DNA-methyltransferase (adenine-specific)